MDAVLEMTRRAHEVLAREVRARANAVGTKLWLLVDPALTDAVGMRLEANGILRYAIPVAHTAAESRPYLVELDFESQESLVQSTLELAALEASGAFDDEEHGRPRSLCAWLMPAAIDNLDGEVRRASERLARWAHVTPPGGLKRAVFRFWDPRIAPELASRLGDAQCTALLNDCGAARWWTLDAEGEFRSLADAAVPPGAEKGASGWSLNSHQWHSLTLLSQRNQLMAMAAQWELEERPGAKTFESIAACAGAHGLATMPDLAAFALCALTLHPAFDQHPRVVQLLSRLQVENVTPGTFALAVGQWEDSFNLELRAGSWRSTRVQTARTQRSGSST